MQNNWTRGVHHDGASLYVSNMYPATGDTVEIKLRIPLNAPVQSVFLRTAPDGENRLTPMLEVGRDAVSIWYAADIHVTMPRIHYRFKLITDTGAYYYNALGLSMADSPDHADFRLIANYRGVDWVQDAVFYQIFPERFHNGDPSNDVQTGEYSRMGAETLKREWGKLPLSWNEGRSLDFYGGDLQGITQKLDYLVDLGVNALYLCPIFYAQSNHKYDILDFHRIDPHFGGDEALVELRKAMDERGMKLILDVTPNHISFAHPWFIAVQEDPEALTAEFFAQDPESDSYETWLGVPSLIKLNYTSQKLRNVMYRDDDSVLRYWLREPYRIDGWRLDVLNMTGNLKLNQLGNEVVREMREAVKQDNPDAYFMGEHFYDASSYLQGDQLDAVMNYSGFNIPMRRWLGGNDLGIDHDQPYGDPRPMATEALALQWQRFIGTIPYVIALQQFNQIGSHDISRVLHVTGGDKALLRLGITLLMAFPGVPCLYYGDEIGMEGANDPDNRRCMPWDDSAWDQDLRTYHQHIIGVRRESHALKYGGFQILYAEGDLVAFQRQSDQQQVIVVGYRGPDDLSETMLSVWEAGIADGTQLVDLIGGSAFVVSDGLITLSGLKHGQALLLEAVK